MYQERLYKNRIAARYEFIESLPGCPDAGRTLGDAPQTLML
ncbi:hypothetical protein C4K05_2269 [Pseudomonas chlororaphis subsp. aureofaciens]|uniref:Uncharacterized protein n=1 Tax=Pseudomonas chlororaphis subsp. aureofaciens TaxID=587851 RepID=A0AAD0ZHA6_9PSED|nr:hypothetical protein C4K12_2237 [Pseudomonas chlororaphis subsp. aureofaciens]AZE28949.1 hypothetical protein C4K07_2164 [Pseudomonas chlororaphis subsp. aureofaciens]AZE35202.1 hypothetical protein C4K06_2169 [Pseudomonas chlororaphis subsp. aureofaciens]AZE41609.1 hypothetical protein C4K05_2269 [Pseudomonas chlororaphis subsp. aureofaciens]